MAVSSPMAAALHDEASVASEISKPTSAAASFKKVCHLHCLARFESEAV